MYVFEALRTNLSIMFTTLLKRLTLPPILLTLSLFTYAQNYSLTLNGSNYANLGSNAAFDASNIKTVEVFVKFNSFAGTQEIVSRSTNSSGLELLIYGGNLSFYLMYNASNASNIDYATSNLSTGLWYHIAAVWDGTKEGMKLYVNGVSVGTRSDVGNINSTGIGAPSGNLLLGDWSDAGSRRYFNGDIDEVRLWSTVQSPSTLKIKMFSGPAVNAAGLIAYYKCNDGSGTTLVNSSSNTSGVDGSLVGSPTFTASPVQFTANSLNFDGSNDAAIIPKSVTSDFTIEFWMKTTQTGGGSAGSQWYSGTGLVDAEVGGVTTDFGITMTGNRAAFGIGQPDVTITSTSAVNTGSWVHIAATWKQSTGAMVLYVNGAQEATGTGGTSLRSAPTRIALGMIQTNGNFYNGFLDEVRIWNTVRTATEIANNMNREVNPASETNLIAQYTFNNGASSGTNTGLVFLIDQKNENAGQMFNFALTGSTSNFSAQKSGLSLIPLKWLSFSAQKKQQEVILQWSTVTETNTREFYIEQSVNGTNWYTIGRISAQNNSGFTSNYSFVDRNPVSNNNYYRIKQIDLDGNFSYSEVKVVRFTNSKQLITIVKNPIYNKIMEVKVEEPMDLQLYNSFGQVLWSKQVQAGYVTLDMSNFISGVYYVSGKGHTITIVIN